VVAYRSSTITTWASRTNTVATAPAGIVNGDALFLFVIVGATSPPTLTPPTGFSLLTGFPASTHDGAPFTVAASAFVKIASSESGSYTITHTVASSQAYMAAYSAPNTSTPFSPNPTVNGVINSTGNGTTTTMLSLTTATNNSVVMTISQDWGDTANNLTPPSGTTPTFTERADTPLLEVADGTLATAGATGNKTMTNNSSLNNPWQGFMFAMPPASGATFMAPKPFTKLQAVNRSYTY
jgi:hypothetical protein